MFTTTNQRATIMDEINAFDMSIYQNLQKETYSQRERSMSIMSDMSDDISHIRPPSPIQEKEEEETCCICFEPMNTKKNYCATLCGHAFCFICIVKTMSKQNSCPCCRASLYQEVEDLRSSDQEVEDLRSSDQEENVYVNVNVIEEYDDQSVMNASLTSNFMIAQNENQPPYSQNDTGNSDAFPHLSDGLQPMNLQNMFDEVGNEASQHDHSLNDLFISALMPDDMEVDTDMSVSLPTYISQEDENSLRDVDRRSGEFRRTMNIAEVFSETREARVVEASSSNHRLEQCPPQTESERQRYPDSSDIPPETEEFINISDILPPSMDNIPRFGDNMILSLHARMRTEGYTMLDVLMITLMKMYPEEIRQDLASYRCARGLNTIIQDLQNETKEKELFAMEDRDVIVM